ncbi:hypothetical protein BGX26_005426 [Mortierella sp. AD094]|nr:hypothetical protein BGX26_005426 [Mortierella sp. AD094]
MEELQSFRIIGATTDVKYIDVDDIDGLKVIYWEDIEQFFPGVLHVQNGKVAVKLLRDSNRNSLVSGDVRTDAPSDAPTGISTLTPTEDKVIEVLQVTLPPKNEPIEQEAPKAKPSFRQIVKHAPKKAQELEIEQRLMSSMTPEMQAQLQASSNVYNTFVQAVKDGQVQQADRLSKEFNGCFQKLETEMVKNIELSSQMIHLKTVLNAKQDEMKQLQVQALGQLAVLQTRVQNYELHEYPIPRLFVVLPQDSSRWDILDPWRNKFRLYFMCECGEHTKSTNSKIPHHIHLAKHEGYDIVRPTEFFQQYGPYVLTILKMLKFSISVTGIAIPAISHLISADVIDQASSGLQQLRDHIGPGMDQVMEYIEKTSVDEGEAVEGVTEQMENKEALEGADLRKLETFLKDKDETKVLGNLYRTVTVEGHVKWVCIDHYRENYQATTAKSFQNMVDAVGGSFDETIGRVEVKLESRVLADKFYLALDKARSVHELKINLSWETSYNDLKRLRDTLHKTRVAVLDFSCGIGPASDILNRGRRYDPIFQIMRHPSIQSYEIGDVPGDFFQRTSELPKDLDLSNLRRLGFTQFNSKYVLDDVDIVKINTLVAQASHLSSLSLATPRDFFKGSRPWPESLILSDLKNLEIGWVMSDEDIDNVKLLVARAPNLSLLSIDTESERLPAVYGSIAEIQTCSIDFKNKMRILQPKNESHPSNLSYQNLAQLFKAHGAQLESLNCGKVPLDDLSVGALDEATQNGSNLKELNCLDWAFLSSDKAIKDLAKIIARSELRLLQIVLESSDVCACILQSIQWEHLRELEIEVRGSEVKALVERIEKIPERVEQGYLKRLPRDVIMAKES